MFGLATAKTLPSAYMQRAWDLTKTRFILKFKSVKKPGMAAHACKRQPREPWREPGIVVESRSGQGSET